MLDLADVVAINKFDRRGAEDALRDVRPAVAPHRDHPGRRRGPAGVRHRRLPVQRRRGDRPLPAPARPARRAARPGRPGPAALARGADVGRSTRAAVVVPTERRGTWPRSPRPSAATTPRTDAGWPRGPPGPAARRRSPPWWRRHRRRAGRRRPGRSAADGRAEALDRAPGASLDEWPATAADLPGPPGRRRRDGDRAVRTSLSGTRVPRVALPRFADHGELVRWLRSENLPGHFPFTAGVFPFKREGEDPARMFAGEGDAVPHQPALPPAGRRASRPPGCPPPSTR